MLTLKATLRIRTLLSVELFQNLFLCAVLEETRPWCFFTFPPALSTHSGNIFSFLASPLGEACMGKWVQLWIESLQT